MQHLEPITSLVDGLDVVGQSHGLHILLMGTIRHYCGGMSRIVFQTYVADIETLPVRITNCISSVMRDVLANMWIEVDYCLDVLQATKGALVEVD